MAAGLAKGAAKRGKQIAFGNGKRLIWDVHSEQIFRHNPNICPPGRERQLQNVEWIGFHRGNRIYNRLENGRWVWNYEFKAIPGEIYLSRNEKVEAERHGSGFILVEPNVPIHKSVAPNKQWPTARYDEVVRLLRIEGYEVIQLRHGSGGHRIPHAKQVTTPDFRSALAMMKRSALYIGPEGGLHHGAAAVSRPAVVMFGGFIPPQVTGYDTHINLTGGVDEACGSLVKCEHCLQAMQKISVEEVFSAARGLLSGHLQT